MGEDTFEMSQKQRDRLKVLHEVAQKKLKQTEAAEQLKLSTRQVRRLVKKMASLGDRAILHGLQGRGSNRTIDADVEKRCMTELAKPECRDFGPTYATEHLQKKLEVKVGRDTVRKWMVAAGKWCVRPRKQASVHQWRPRRSCCGELVQWDTSVHAWLEDRGPQLYLIAMLDDATSRLFGRFVEHDSAEENMRTLKGYLKLYGRPLDFYTDKAAMFEVAAKRGATNESDPMAPTQITRALMELGIGRISAHSPQAKGRVERCFGTLQDRLVKHLRLAKARTLEQANTELEKFLKEWNVRFTQAPANATDAHRPLGECDLDATLSFVKHPRVENNYTFSFRSKRYQIAKSDARPGLRGQKVRVEQRLDGTVAARDQDRYLDIRRCEYPEPATPSKAVRLVRKDHNRGGRSSWMRGFSVRSTVPPLSS